MSWFCRWARRAHKSALETGEYDFGVDIDKQIEVLRYELSKL